MKYLVAFCVSALFMFHTPFAIADEFVGTGSRWPIPQTNAIASDPSIDYVFVGDGDTLNVFQKNNIELVTFLRLTNISEGIRALVYAPDKNVLYAACGYSGLQIIDVEDPTHPFEAGSFTTSDHRINANTVNAYDISLFNDYIFMADKDYGLRVLSIAVAKTPVELGWMELVSLPSSYKPLRVGVYSTGPTSNVTAIMMMDSAYGPVISRIGVSGFEAPGLTLTRIMATGLPTVMGTVSLDVEENYVYCPDGYGNDLLIYDVSHDNMDEDGNDISPELVFSQRTNSAYTSNKLVLYQPRGIDIHNNTVYITTHGYYNDADADNALNYFGLNVIDISDPTAPLAVNRYKMTGANSVMIMDNHAYITSLRDGLNELDLTSDEESVTITKTRTYINAFDVCIQKDIGIAYIADNIARPDCGLTLIRLKPDTVEDDEDGETTITRYASPALPIREMFLPTPGTAKATCIANTNYFAYVADGPGGIQVLRLKESGAGAPVIIPGSNIPAPASYDVIDVSVLNNGVTDMLMAVTTDPDQEVWIVDVSADTTLDNPATYVPIPLDFVGDTATSTKITHYTWGSSIYAMVTRGSSGLSIFRLNPDDEHPETMVLPPAVDNVFQIDADEALAIYANSDQSGMYAFLADGASGVKIIQLFQEDNQADMHPSVIHTIDTSEYGKAIDVYCYKDSASRHLYVLTDNPESAVLLYQVIDMENPEFMGYVSSYGQGSALWATEITMASSASITGQATIRGVFVADGPGGLSFRQTTNDPTSLRDRVWPDDSATFCFISTPFTSVEKTGFFPVFMFLLICLGLVLVFAMVLHRRTKN
ncbi:MAG: hypothetical protein KKD44_08485 [Proteobacteria bacterium]|nr:hypothetical protein [Pseudomonadota bacterium]